ncbi:MAG: helix-turn-helix domain-containing protein [Prevotellaceae bacterium]|jgi:transcriptional regulator with XRE-family HTH domain|nr:helix-turn-helix domain-containing protein [Prevotellaceae bacterium]
MKDRIINFLNAEKLSPARFADIIGVQPANISHIISERNKPSLDFIQKMLKSFPQLNVEWLITGSGKMYREAREQSLFDDKFNDLFSSTSNKTDENIEEKSINNDKAVDILAQPEPKYNSREVERIIICYSDKTFEFYFPR